MADEKREESLRLKTIAESKFSISNLKSSLKFAIKARNLNPSLEGISSMITALKILKVASKENPEWYGILQVEPFSHINSIKKQYKKLALLLHPDKNSFVGCEDAFKLVSEGFRVLIDKIRRKEYDLKLRIRLQEERECDDVGGSSKVETFWACCSKCRLLHQFERRYLGHNLVCPGCKKSFKAVEVEEENEEGAGGVRSEQVRENVCGLRAKSQDGDGIGGLERKRRSGEKLKENEGAGVWSGGRLRAPGLKRKIFSVDEVSERSKPKKVKFVDDETMTLAEMLSVAKKKASLERSKSKEKEKENQNLDKEKQNGEKEKQKEEKQKENQNVEKQKEKQNKERNIEEHHTERNIEKKKKDEAATKNIKDVDRENVTTRKSRDVEIETTEVVKKYVETEKSGVSRKSVVLKSEHRGPKSGGLKYMEVEDSDFYDFDRDRMERSFKKGQVWAIYDDDDGMPRHYGLIDEVVSVNPFQLRLCWLDLQTNGNQRLIGLQKIGFHVPCGRYKVGKTTTTKSLNIFSHVVECERAAREIYRIYPKKGSVWAVYDEANIDAEGGNLAAADNRRYDIFIVLSNYSEIHGLSTAYLEKVDGFKTVFKRREIGCHAVRLLGKDDLRLFSHQIPSRKFSGNDVPELLKDCWELDPASLPSIERKK